MTPVVVYSPGGGSGSSGQPGQHDALWQQLGSAGATVLYLQNAAESAPGSNLWQLRRDVVLWALAHTAQFQADFGAPIGPQSPASSPRGLGVQAMLQGVAPRGRRLPARRQPLRIRRAGAARGLVHRAEPRLADRAPAGAGWPGRPWSRRPTRDRLDRIGQPANAENALAGRQAGSVEVPSPYLQPTSSHGAQ
jgi:hypothetical protein